MFDKNPKTTEADAYIAGKTTEQVLRTMLEAQRNLHEVPHPWLVALVARFDRKAERRADKAEAA